MNQNKRLKLVIAFIVALSALISTNVMAAKTVQLPQDAEYGTLHTYTVWDAIRWGGDCKQLINFMSAQSAILNNSGIVTYGGYFCGALTSTFGKVGDMMLVIQEDNTVYPVIMADTKNQRDRGCNAWGHYYGKCVVEFEILSSFRKSLYGGSGGYISDVLSKPVARIINIGSVYDSTAYLWNPKQACLDHGLIGYTLLTSPYGGEAIVAPCFTMINQQV